MGRYWITIISVVLLCGATASAQELSCFDLCFDGDTLSMDDTLDGVCRFADGDACTLGTETAELENCENIGAYLCDDEEEEEPGLAIRNTVESLSTLLESCEDFEPERPLLCKPLRNRFKSFERLFKKTFPDDLGE